MILAEALLLRSDLQKQLASLKQRINSNMLVQEGDEPNEHPQDLIIHAMQLNKQLHQLILQIHRTNAVAKLQDGRSLLSVLLQRDEWIEHHKILTQAIQYANKEPERYSSREIKWQKVMKVAHLQKQADKISAEIRDLNMLIQEHNWKIQLLEA
ncbi:MAG: DIP1984 family protein [Acinetobacter sp.]|nr:DIP1984 family protein [Acinetobacter sp.]